MKISTSHRRVPYDDRGRVSKEEQALARLAREGKVTLPDEGPHEFGLAERIPSRGFCASEMVLEDRT